MATVRTIEMDDHGEPEFVTVRMSLEELAYLAKVTGKHSTVTAEEIMHGGAANTHLYDCASGEVFNRYYDGGVDDYLNHHH